jgi:general secretion pathway protein H
MVPRLHPSPFRLPPCCGFTLLELVVVLLLVMIIFGMVGLNLGDREGADLHAEAERLVLLLQTAQQEAILQGWVLAISVQPRGYQFLRLQDSGTLTPLVGDELLRARELPAGIRISAVEIDGNLQEGDAGIVLQPSGEIPEFTITLRKGSARWQVKGSTAEGIQLQLSG